MNPDQAQKIVAWGEAVRAKVRQMLRGCFPEQRAAIQHPGLLKAFLCTRRAGKSWAIGVILFATCLLYPGCSCLYMGLTLGTAKAIMNKDILQAINVSFGVDAVWHESKNCWLFPNGSVLYLRGADANAYEIAKVVGQKYRVAVLDEVSKYRQDVHTMVYGFLLPAMGDDIGTIIISGTPSNVTSGLFYDVTKDTKADKVSGWYVFRWTWHQNVWKRDNIRVVHDTLVEANPAIVATPLYRQEWRGEWVVNLEALVYKFSDKLNTIAELPHGPDAYTYGLAVDFGFTDATALVVSAYSRHDPVLYLVYAHKKRGQTISEVAQDIKDLWWCPSEKLRGPYPFAFMVGDAAARQTIEEMAKHHHLPIVPGRKTDIEGQKGKEGVIRVMNSDLLTGRIKVLPAAMCIVEEWGSLIWDERLRAELPPKFVEDPRFDNHLSDGALYNWRKARNYDAVDEKPREPMPGTAEYEERRHQREVQAAKQAARRGDHGGIGVHVDEFPAWVRGLDND